MALLTPYHYPKSVSMKNAIDSSHFLRGNHLSVSYDRMGCSFIRHSAFNDRSFHHELMGLAGILVMCCKRNSSRFPKYIVFMQCHRTCKLKHWRKYFCVIPSGRTCDFAFWSRDCYYQSPFLLYGPESAEANWLNNSSLRYSPAWT